MTRHISEDQKWDRNHSRKRSLSLQPQDSGPEAGRRTRVCCARHSLAPQVEGRLPATQPGSERGPRKTRSSWAARGWVHTPRRPRKEERANSVSVGWAEMPTDFLTGSATAPSQYHWEQRLRIVLLRAASGLGAWRGCQTERGEHRGQGERERKKVVFIKNEPVHPNAKT